MKSWATAVRQLMAAFRGELPEQSEWEELIRVANLGWLVPTLYVASRDHGVLERIPADARAYLELLHERNLARNRRLKAQLIEAIAFLNAADIQPILLKGAIGLFTARDEELGARMLSDLDINVEPSQMDSARRALASLGYREGSIPRELHRPDDAGELELHDRPSRRSGGYLVDDLWDFTTLVERHDVKAGIPDATAQALHLIVHDMIKEGDAWRLRIDLRHLHDLANLARRTEGLNWGHLASALPSKHGRSALRLQATALADLYNICVPAELTSDRMVKLKHALRLAGTEKGLRRMAARTVGNLLWGFHRLADDNGSKGAIHLMKRVYGVFTRPASGSRI